MDVHIVIRIMPDMILVCCSTYNICTLSLKMHRLLWCSFLLLCCSTFATCKLNNVSDQQSLFSFKDSITRDPSNVLGDWLANISFCNWRGVTCSASNHRVRSLNLTGAQLEGSISSSLGNLSFIRLIDLSNNSLGGQIPPELGRLHRLNNLVLWSNGLEGSIPTSLGGCRNLVGLSLADNHLSGSIPTELSLLRNLQRLLLRSNRLTGTIPPSFGNFSSLKALLLGSNSLEGRIPPELGLLTQLKSLYIFDNHLTGTIPSSLSNISTLAELCLYTNNLVGVIPPELGKLKQLEVLYLWDNQLSGSIPNSLANCSQLKNLQVDINRLSGTVPLELGKLPYLRTLSLSSNQFVSGSTTSLPIITALTNCSLLQELYFDSNYLTGVLDQLPANLSQLNLSINSISGSIPRQIGNLTGLTWLDLSSNLLTGHVPTALGRLEKLERLWLDNNKLEGSLPSEIGELQSLGELSISMNMLTGHIPDTIGKLQKLRDLILRGNRLSGNIPSTLGNCYVLENLDLSNNLLQGSIPPEVAGLPNLQIYFNLSRNFLQGLLPLEISKMIHVQRVDISANQLSGHIPATLESCAGLEYLNLSGNALQGPIPNSLAQLKSLGVLDLSSNKLSGSIPTSLEGLEMLHALNLSFNGLAGEIPKGGAFANLTAASFMGNPFLCGQWIVRMPPCPVLTRKKSTHSLLLKTIIAPIAAVFALVLCCLSLGFYWRPRLHKQIFTLSKTITLKLGYTRISYQELLNATNEFNRANLLGVGSFGSVYKGKLNDGTIAAIKILNMQNRQANKSFATECGVLSRARHRNLVKIITSYSNLQLKALILQFMSNGSLEKHLYPDGSDVAVPGLRFRDRLNIAIDMAHAMEYLHHDCSVQVVHCDLKPSNVLLDEDMTANVADFGIAKLMCEDSTDSLSSTLALKGSVGYIAPEYGSNGKVSTKGDVYSYGIILLEMITGKKPTGDMFAGEVNLQRWVRMHYPDRVAEIVDGNLAKNMKDEGMEEDEILERLIPFINVGLMCTRESPYERPTMREVVRALWSMRAEQPSISPSTLQTLIGSTSTTMNGSRTLDSPNSPRSAAGLV